ncbi:MAG: Asp23/Gls24 family envelope stress response protein [Catonella sp.]|jgi:uncharacterized alkaline shock family protein YloU|nr:Asp23/Gls24 family envelope stress response protein [Catonella sp.]MDY6356394.1 Asp23/Gls24 family envelope stress response protein [Catonella sp.]
MKGYMNTDIGEVAISQDVIANYAGSAACECFGIVGMAIVSVKDGISTLLGRENLSKGVEVSVNANNEIKIKLHVIIAYGVNISTVCDNLEENVRYKVEKSTGMKVRKITVYVEGVRVTEQ